MKARSEEVDNNRCFALLSHILEFYTDDTPQYDESNSRSWSLCVQQEDQNRAAVLDQLQTEQMQRAWVEVMRHHLFPQQGMPWPSQAEEYCRSNSRHVLVECMKHAEAALAQAAFSTIENVQRDEQMVDSWFL